MKTRPYWNDWFKGLSKLFLQCDPVKILVLANVERLDKELLVSIPFLTMPNMKYFVLGWPDAWDVSA